VNVAAVSAHMGYLHKAQIECRPQHSILISV
jgi:hypothetical protein